MLNRGQNKVYYVPQQTTVLVGEQPATQVQHIVVHRDRMPTELELKLMPYVGGVVFIIVIGIMASVAFTMLKEFFGKKPW